MILDGHIHTFDARPNPSAFHDCLRAAGVAGGLVISAAPPAFGQPTVSGSCQERLAQLAGWTGGHPQLYPFYWIDPLEEGALDQAGLAVSGGIAGFKVVCDRFFPCEARPLELFRAIADANKPILFHSGILWDGKPSSRYNRPAEFEGLLDVPGLRFALAHVGWPWYDELIAVYGKFQQARRARQDLSVEIFIDTTPGTPNIYRREVFARLFTVGYEVRDHVFFGSDSLANDYAPGTVQDLLTSDMKICRDIGLDEGAISAMLGRNLRRFVGAE